MMFYYYIPNNLCDYLMSLYLVFKSFAYSVLTHSLGKYTIFIVGIEGVWQYSRQ